MNEVRERVRRCLAAVTDGGAVETLGPSEFRAFDSVQILQLRAMLEEEFDLGTDDAFAAVDSLDAVVRYISDRL